MTAQYIQRFTTKLLGAKCPGTKCPGIVLMHKASKSKKNVQAKNVLGTKGPGHG